MEMLLLDEAFHSVSAHLFWRSTKLFCAVASLYLSKELQHFTNTIPKATACVAERHSGYPTWIDPEIFTTVREKYSLEAIFLYFKTNLKDTTAVLSGDFDMIILPYFEFGLYLTLKKKEWELHLTIPNELRYACIVWSYYYWILVGCTSRTLCSFIVLTMCVKWLSFKSVHAT